MFAGSCIGVILLVMALEAIRRGVKEYDRYIISQHTVSSDSASKGSVTDSALPILTSNGSPGFRPNFGQQAIRALLHMVQFAVAYFIMLWVLLPR